MKKINRYLILLFAVMMLALPLASCSGNSETASASASEETTAAVTTTGVDRLQLPTVDYSDYDFNILLRKPGDIDFVADMYVSQEDANASLMNKAVYQRNEAVIQATGINITYQTSSSNNGDADMVNALLLGDDTYDLIANHGRFMTVYATQGTLANWYDMNYLFLDEEWWNEGMKDEFTVNGKLWLMTGDISYQSLGSTLCMLMNKNVCQSYGMEYPYEDALNGTWTFEKFSEMAKNANGIYGDQQMMGYITRQYAGPLTVLYIGGDLPLLNNGSQLELNVKTAGHSSIFSDFFGLMENPQNNCRIYLAGEYTTDGGKGDLRSIFARGGALFTDMRLYEVRGVQALGMEEYAVLPWPKYNENVDKYYAWCDAIGNCFGVPYTVTGDRLERVSIVLELLAREGNKTVIPAFYEKTLLLRNALDLQSMECMNLIKEGR